MQSRFQQTPRPSSDQFLQSSGILERNFSHYMPFVFLILRLGPVDFELGVIAGNQNRRPGIPGLPDVPSDGTVTVAETRVAGMTDFIEMPAGP